MTDGVIISIAPLQTVNGNVFEIDVQIFSTNFAVKPITGLRGKCRRTCEVALHERHYKDNCLIFGVYIIEVISTYVAKVISKQVFNVSIFY